MMLKNLSHLSTQMLDLGSNQERFIKQVDRFPTIFRVDRCQIFGPRQSCLLEHQLTQRRRVTLNIIKQVLRFTYNLFLAQRIPIHVFQHTQRNRPNHNRNPSVNKHKRWHIGLSIHRIWGKLIAQCKRRNERTIIGDTQWIIHKQRHNQHIQHMAVNAPLEHECLVTIKTVPTIFGIILTIFAFFLAQRRFLSLALCVEPESITPRQSRIFNNMRFSIQQLLFNLVTFSA
mmetsp:Transcript_38302/g.62795  ORF Transcript_38302/g.62795 Transcript_38302/m.62795 type:complete len:230 (+) Transcript_38302:727-1416(+)